MDKQEFQNVSYKSNYQNEKMEGKATHLLTAIKKQVGKVMKILQFTFTICLIKENCVIWSNV